MWAWHSSMSTATMHHRMSGARKRLFPSYLVSLSFLFSSFSLANGYALSSTIYLFPSLALHPILFHLRSSSPIAEILNRISSFPSIIFLAFSRTYQLTPSPLLVPLYLSIFLFSFWCCFPRYLCNSIFF